MNNLTALIMAAETSVPAVDRVQVLHPICGTPILRLACNAAAGLNPEKMIVVVGMKTEGARASLAGISAHLVFHEAPLSSGYEFLRSWDTMGRREGDLLFLYGHTPRIKTETLQRLVEHHRHSEAATTLLAAEGPTEERQTAGEVNPGLYCFRIGNLLQALDRLSDQRKPLSISHIVESQRRNGERIEALVHPDFDELRTVSTCRELAAVSRTMRMEKNHSLLDAGVTLIDPEITYVDLEVVVECGAVLHPLVTLEGRSHIGAGSVIHSGTRIADSVIGPGVDVLDCCVIVESEVGTGSTVGPFAHLRSQVKIGERCRIGNYVEVKKSRLGNGSKAAHLSYLGDATLGEKVNIGAGTITCNYDGSHKYPTIIEDGVFVGTASQLIAPVRIGKGSYVAAGSCITDDVPPESLAIARSRQTNKTGWKRRRKETKGD